MGMAVGAIIIKTSEEVELIRESSLLVGKTLGEVSRWIKPGVSTLELDRVAEEFIRDHGGIPAFKDYPSGSDAPAFPATLCLSLNEEVVHGIPSEEKVLREGDIISVDCGVLKNGFFGDCAYTFAVGEVASKKQRLLKITEESLYKGLEKVVVGARLGDISQAIQYHVECNGFSIVQEMVGHGIGRNLHEPPEIPNYGRKNTGPILEEGMVFAIEPMVNMGKRRIVLMKDGWTIKTADGMPSAHFEHTIVVRKNQCEVLSSHDFILN